MRYDGTLSLFFPHGVCIDTFWPSWSGNALSLSLCLQPGRHLFKYVDQHSLTTLFLEVCPLLEIVGCGDLHPALRIEIWPAEES